jgi:hypothetical protein
MSSDGVSNPSMARTYPADLEAGGGVVDWGREPAGERNEQGGEGPEIVGMMDVRPLITP